MITSLTVWVGFIDDRERNITVGQKVGLQGILFKNYRQLEQELRRFGISLDKDQSRNGPALDIPL